MEGGAAKDRPVAIVTAIRGEGDEVRVIVAPITYEPASDPEASIEAPAPFVRHSAFDDLRQWLRLDELNRFTWPGFDLRPIPGPHQKYDYGMLPRDLFDALREGILRRQRGKAVAIQDRD